MQKVTAKIVSLNPKSITSKTSGKSFTIWSANLDNGLAVAISFNKQKYKPGDTFDHWVTSNKYNELEITEAPTSSGVAQIVPNAHQFTPSKGNVQVMKTFPVEGNHPDMSIIRQSALKAALEYHALLGKKTVTIDDILATAYDFADFSSGQREVKVAKQLGGSKELKELVAKMQAANEEPTE